MLGFGGVYFPFPNIQCLWCLFGRLGDFVLFTAGVWRFEAGKYMESTLQGDFG